MHLYCERCGQTRPLQFKPFCECGGMTDVGYELSEVTLHDSPNPYIRFAELLPIQSSHDRLPTDAVYTPVIHAKALGEQLGLPHLYLKDETGLPTCSTKDRMAAVSLAYLWESGVRSFCTSSTGNSSTAYARVIPAFPDMHLYLFTAETFVPRVQHAAHPQVTHFGLRGASFVDAFNYAGQFARENGYTSERGFFNLGRREGLKIAFLEAVEQVPRPIDWYVQAVSSAMGVYGTYKGARELWTMKRIPRLPRLLCVQQEVCAPMVRAYQEGCEAIEPQHIVHRPRGLAESILRGDPTNAYPHVRRIVRESQGNMVAVSDAEIREARTLVEDLEGVSPCFSASAAIAGLIQQARQFGIPSEHTVLINVTGADRPRTPAGDDDTVSWMVHEALTWRPE